MAEFDVMIKGGTVFDGRRNPRFSGDVAVKDGRIAALGRLRASDAKRVIDASGLMVAPGFVDMHTHYDSQLFWDPYCSPSGWHGITSVVIGNCGFGFAPVRPEGRDRAMLSMTRNEAVPLACMQQGMPWDWVTFPEFLDSVDRTPKSVNVLSFVPISPLMVWVMGLERAKAGELPTDAEHAEMCRVLSEAMDAGASGVSAQRMGEESRQRDYDGTPMVSDLMHDETMLALADVLADRNDGVIQYTYIDFSVLYGDTEGTVKRVRPHIEAVARRSGRPTIVGGANEADPAWLAACRQQALSIYGMGTVNTIVRHPRIGVIADNPQAFDISLKWCAATAGTHETIRENLANPKVRASMRSELPQIEDFLGKMETWVIAGGTKSAFEEMPLGQIAPTMRIDDLLDAFCEINLADDLRTKWAFPTPRGEFMADTLETHKAIAASPYMIPGISDGGAHTKTSVGADYSTLYLTQYVRTHGWHDLEEAHWRLSGLPAHCAGIHDRGVIAEGAAADIVVYDFENLEVTARETVHDYPGNEWRLVDHGKGYRNVLVNGEITIEDDVQTDIASGRLLRNGRAT